MARRLALVALALTACRDEVANPANVHFDPLCGGEGPVELLRLGDDEEIGWIDRIGDEGDMLVIVGPTDEALTDEMHPEQRRLVIERCGGEAVELSPNIAFLWSVGDVLFACLDRDIVRMESYDDPSPAVLTRGSCGMRSVGDRWVALDIAHGSTSARLVSIDVTSSRVSVEPLVEDILVADPDFVEAPAVVDEHVFVQTTDLAIHQVDLDTGEISLELEAAQMWSVHASSLAYRAPGPSPDEPGPLVVRDRRTGTEQTLDAELPTSWRFWWWTDEVLRAGPGGSLVRRWFWTDPLREIVPPEGTQIETVRDDGLVWLTRVAEHPTAVEILRWREDEAPQLAMTCTMCGVVPSARSIEVVVTTPFAYEHELWRLDDTGGPARMLAYPVGDEYLATDDERVLTVVYGSDSQHGPLLLHDGSEDPPVTLAPRVRRHAIDFTALYDEPGEILYEAVPQHGTHALFRARLSP